MSKLKQDLRGQDIERRLALAVCRGDRQVSIVNELLAGPVYVYSARYSRSSYARQGDMWPVVGRTQIGWSSFKSLKSRLLMVGFVFEEGRDPVTGHDKFTMIFPEGQRHD